MVNIVRVILAVIVMALASPCAGAQRMAVAASIANIRSGPGTNYDVIWQIARYHPIKVEQKKGNWYLFVDFQGDRGWIHKSLVDKTETVITDKSKCNVRAEPVVKDGNILFQVPEGIPFRVIRRKGNWLQVEHADGDRGWIHRSLVW